MSRLAKQTAARTEIAQLEQLLNETISNLVAAKVRFQLLQELELSPPVPRRRAAATSMTKREKIARVLRAAHPEGLPLARIQGELKRAYSEHIERPTLSPMLNRLKRDGYIYRGRLGNWYWANDHDLAVSLF